MNRIKELREKAGMKQEELGLICDVGQSTISSWEVGQSIPRPPKLEILSRRFNVSVDYILGLTDEPQPSTPQTDDDLWNLREQLRRDPERQILFSLARDADISEVRQAVAIIDALKKTSGR